MQQVEEETDGPSEESEVVATGLTGCGDWDLNGHRV
jgi:hypothetical protein